MQGELYKKLAVKADEVSSFIASEKGVTDILEGRDNPYLDGMVWDYLKKVLDEARADAPKHYQGTPDDAVAEMFEWMDWFKKWFGAP